MSNPVAGAFGHFSISDCSRKEDTIINMRDALMQFEKTLKDSKSTVADIVKAYANLENMRPSLDSLIQKDPLFAPQAKAMLHLLDKIDAKAKTIYIKLPVKDTDNGRSPDITDAQGNKLSLYDVMQDEMQHKNLTVNVDWITNKRDRIDVDHGGVDFSWNFVRNRFFSFFSHFHEVFPTLPASAFKAFSDSCKYGYDHVFNNSHHKCRHADGNLQSFTLPNGDKINITATTINGHIHTIGKFHMSGNLSDMLTMCKLDCPVGSGGGGNPFADVNKSLGMGG